MTEVNTIDHARTVVMNLYMNGSDMRQQKNGSPGLLVEKITTAHPITSCGIYSLLDRRDQKTIDDKKGGNRDDPEFQKRVAIILLRYANKYDRKIFVRLMIME